MALIFNGLVNILPPNEVVGTGEIGTHLKIPFPTTDGGELARLELIKILLLSLAAEPIT
ncbi:hypothetical protein EMGBS15_01080 [Filimonas sp.]|nr:hypothetical protein EMGBS15_01080 [Filimonas sp.]